MLKILCVNVDKIQGTCTCNGSQWKTSMFLMMHNISNKLHCKTESQNLQQAEYATLLRVSEGIIFQ